MDKNITKQDNNSKDLEPLFAVSNEPSTRDLAAWVLKLLKYWYLFVIGIVVAGGLAYLKLFSYTRTYRTTTTILIEDSRSNLKNDFTSGYGASYGNKNIINQMIMYNSYDFISRAIDKLNLTSEIYLKQRFKNITLYKQAPFDIEINYVTDQAYGKEFQIQGVDNDSFTISYVGDERTPAFKITGKYDEFIQHNLFFINITKTDYFVKPNYLLHFKFNNKNALVNSYGSRLSTRMMGENSSVIEVSLTGKVAQRDIDFLNVLNEQFFEDNLARKNEIAERSVEFLDRQISIMKDSIGASEQKLNTYQLSSGLYNTEVSSTRTKELTELNSIRNELQLQKNYIKLLSEGISNPNYELLPDPSSYQVINPSLSSYIAQYNAVLSEMKSLGKENPVYKKSQTTLQDLNTSITRSIQNMSSAIQMREEQINRQYSTAQSQLASLPQQERRLLTFERDFKLNETYHTYLLQRRTESQIQKASNTPDNLVIDKPRVVGVTNGSEPRDTYLLFILIGILVPFIFVASKEFIFKFTVQSREEVERITGFPLLGTIERSKKKNELVVKNHPRSSFSEGFRSLRSRMEYIARKEAPVSMLVTSTEPRDGKTFIALNMASVYEIANKKVVLVDFDLRRPALSKTLGYENSIGLSNYLIGKASLEEIIQHHKESGIDVVPAGVTPPNPSELVRAGQTKELLEALYEMYDYIIIDCSPAGLVTDAYYLSRLVDVVLFVVRNEKTNKNFLKYTIKEFRDDEIKNVTTVYNDVDIKTGYYGNRRYYGKSSYYTRHGNYYHND